jgi:hypothetical protein
MVSRAIGSRENRPQLAHIPHDDLMLHLLELQADPDRMRSRRHRDRTGGGSVNAVQPRPVWCETGPVYEFTFFVERAEMTPDYGPGDHPDQVLWAPPGYRFELWRNPTRQHLPRAN